MQTKVMEEEDDDEDNMSTTKGNRGIRSERERERELAQRLINLEIPVLVRSLKSSNIELG